MATAGTTSKPNILEGLTRQFERTHGQYIVPPKEETLPNYHTVCGRDDTDRSTAATHTNLLTQFTEQIGCPARNHESWVAQKNYYRDQFAKARICFHGRAKAMGDHTAITPEEVASRQRHAYAAQAARVLGRNCIRKFANIPGAEGIFEESAESLINSVNTAQPGVRAALNAELAAGRPLQIIYEETYGLSPHQWDLYRKFLQYSAVKASNYKQGETQVAAARNAFYATFVVPDVTEPGVTAVGGAGFSPSSAVTPDNAKLAEKLASIKIINDNTLLKEASHAVDLPHISLLTDDELRTSIVKFKDIEHFADASTKIINNFKDERMRNLFLLDPKNTLKRVLLPLIYYTALLNIAIAKINAIDSGIGKIEARLASVKKTRGYEDSPFYKDVLVPIRARISKYTELRKIISDLFVFFDENRKDVVTAISKNPQLLSDFHLLTTYNSAKTDYPLGYPVSTLLRLSWQDTWPYLDRDDKMSLFDELLTLLQKGRALV